MILSLVIKDIFFWLLFKCVGNIYGTIKLKQLNNSFVAIRIID